MGKVNRKRWSLYLARRREKREKVRRLLARWEKAPAAEKPRLEEKLRRVSLPYSVLELPRKEPAHPARRG